MKKVYLSLLFLFALLSCQSNDAEIFLDNNSVNLTEEESVITDCDSHLISKDLVDLSIADALNVSRKFQTDNNLSTRSMDELLVDDITPLLLEDGTPYLYVVNYKNDKGYTIISASKTYMPILSFSEKGNFSVSEENLANNAFIQHYKDVISNSKTMDADSLRSCYSIYWDSYEKRENTMPTRSHVRTEAEIESLKQAAISQYEALGYDCFGMNAVSYMVPTGDAQGMINDICQHTNRYYDCMDVDVFMIRRGVVEKSPLIMSEWHQTSPYHAAASNGMAGCIPIAVGQIMKYYEWPNSINWSNIPLSFSFTTSAYYSLMSNLQSLLHIDDSRLDVTVSSPNYINSALSAMSYNCSTFSYTTFGQFDNYLSANKPLIVVGYNNGNPHGHAWVCDGIRHYRTEYAFLVYDNFDEYEMVTEQTMRDAIYWHANLCENSFNQGWYYSDDYLGFEMTQIYCPTPRR